MSSCPTWSRRLSEAARVAQRTGTGGALGAGLDGAAVTVVDGVTADGDCGAALALTAAEGVAGTDDASTGDGAVLGWEVLGGEVLGWVPQATAVRQAARASVADR
jgi:hypothetical protein